MTIAKNSYTQGQGIAQVRATGLRTEMGKIGTALQTVQVEGTPRRLGILSVKGSNTATADVPLPLRPEKVTADEYHSILCTMKQ